MSAQAAAKQETQPTEVSLNPTLRFVFVNGTQSRDGRDVAADQNAMLRFVREVTQVEGAQKGHSSLAAHAFVDPNRLPSIGPRADLGPALPVREITAADNDAVLALISSKFKAVTSVEGTRNIVQAGLLIVREELPTVLVDIQAVAKMQAEEIRLAEYAAGAPARAAAIEASNAARRERMSAAARQSQALYEQPAGETQAEYLPQPPRAALG